MLYRTIYALIVTVSLSSFLEASQLMEELDLQVEGKIFHLKPITKVYTKEITSVLGSEEHMKDSWGVRSPEAMELYLTLKEQDLKTTPLGSWIFLDQDKFIGFGGFKSGKEYQTFTKSPSNPDGVYGPDSGGLRKDGKIEFSLFLLPDYAGLRKHFIKELAAYGFKQNPMPKAIWFGYLNEEGPKDDLTFVNNDMAYVGAKLVCLPYPIKRNDGAQVMVSVYGLEPS
jgi:hypothetical protein